jgi:hypothetical protein
MTITFADGTRIDVPASALTNFFKDDLKWVEFVHGPVSETQTLKRAPQIPAVSPMRNVNRCPSRSC